MGFGIFVQTPCAGRHGCQLYHTVAAVDIQNLGYRAESMGGIVVAAAVLVVAQTVMTSLIPQRDFVTQVMLITTLAVYNLSEQAFPHHTHNHQFIGAVAAIFNHHAVDTGFFISIYQLPAVVDRIGTANFNTDLFAAFHRVHSRRNMVFPGRTYKNHIHFGRFNQFSIILCPCGGVVFLVLYKTHCCVTAIFVQITHARYTNVFSFGKNVLHLVHTASAKTDQPYSEFSHTYLRSAI